LPLVLIDTDRMLILRSLEMILVTSLRSPTSFLPFNLMMASLYISLPVVIQRMGMTR
jgi:hypothetical protein